MSYQTNYGPNYSASSYVAPGSLILLCYSLKIILPTVTIVNNVSLLERAINKDGINFSLPDHSSNDPQPLRIISTVLFRTFMLYWLRFYVQEMHEDLLRESIRFIQEPHMHDFLLRRIYPSSMANAVRWNRYSKILRGGVRWISGFKRCSPWLWNCPSWPCSRNSLWPWLVALVQVRRTRGIDCPTCGLVSLPRIRSIDER